MVQQHVAGLAEVFGHWRGAGAEEGVASEADGVATVHAMRRAQAAGSGGELLRHLAAAGCGPQQPLVAMPPLQPAQPPRPERPPHCLPRATRTDDGTWTASLR